MYRHYAALDTLKDGQVIELSYRTVDGPHVSWVLHREVVFRRDEQGRPSELLGVTNDVTSLVEAHESLQAHRPPRRNWRAVFDRLESSWRRLFGTDRGTDNDDDDEDDENDDDRSEDKLPAAVESSAATSVAADARVGIDGPHFDDAVGPRRLSSSPLSRS